MNSDENKTFGVVLRTPWENSKGHPAHSGAQRALRQPQVPHQGDSTEDLLRIFHLAKQTCKRRHEVRVDLHHISIN